MTPTTSVPCLDDYDVSPESGFLSEREPCAHLSSTLYAPWESLARDLTPLVIHRKLRDRVHELPVLSTSDLNGCYEHQRAFHLLSLLAHAYVWGLEGDGIMQILPKQLSLPWLEVSAFLGTRPVSTHAATVLWNWRKLVPELPVTLNNITTLELTRGGIDESWFFLVTVGVEAAGGPALAALIDAMKSTVRHDAVGLGMHLAQIAVHVRQMSAVLDRMRENCDVGVFYNRIRRHLQGWNDREIFPRGLQYEGDDGRILRAEIDEIQWVKETFGSEDSRDCLIDENRAEGEAAHGEGVRYGGATAAQSSLLAALDIGLGVQHCHKPSAFLREMQWHMSKKHRQLLYDLERGPDIHALVIDLAHGTVPGCDERAASKCVDAYNAALESIENFRRRHLEIVEAYIIKPAKGAEAGLRDATGSIEGNLVKGTGGAGHLLSFLGNLRDETCLAKISAK
ncbi:hypothetical protein HDU86_008346 [Geranomyces michiganensis]|nr:hypothetical protein HDU86_008346 [Geranomyces michiganensis]